MSPFRSTTFSESADRLTTTFRWNTLLVASWLVPSATTDLGQKTSGVGSPRGKITPAFFLSDTKTCSPTRLGLWPKWLLSSAVSLHRSEWHRQSNEVPPTK